MACYSFFIRLSSPYIKHFVNDLFTLSRLTILGLIKMHKTKLAFVLLIVVATAVSCIDPLYPNEQMLQHLGTLVLFVPLARDLFRNKLPLPAFIGIACFTFLHILGAHYIYSYVPYKEWAVTLDIVDADFFQSPRNHFDRLVHFSFGLLILPSMLHLAKQWIKDNTWTALFMAWLMIQTGSLIYELFEWSLTIVMASESADYYNGQQGDMWDAQKDMALALVGSTITSGIYAISFYFSRQKNLN